MQQVKLSRWKINNLLIVVVLRGIVRFIEFSFNKLPEQESLGSLRYNRQSM